MRHTLRGTLTFSVLVLAAGCATAQPASAYGPRKVDSTIAVMQTVPRCPYTVLSAEIDAANWNLLRQKARLANADALIGFREETTDDRGSRVRRLYATPIRFTDPDCRN